MIKLKNTFIIGFAAIVLGACGGETSKNKDTTSAPALDQQEQTILSESASVDSEEAGLDDLDVATKIELEKEDAEEIDWEKIHFTKRQFKEYINRLHTTLNEPSIDEADENTLTVQSIEMLNEQKIEIMIENTDESEFSEFTNSFFGWTMDTIIRQMYSRSDFYDGVTQPTIIVMDQEGEIISESSDFIELEEP